MPVFSVQIGPNQRSVSSKQRQAQQLVRLTSGRHALHAPRSPAVQGNLEEKHREGEQYQLRCADADQKAQRGCEVAVQIGQTSPSVPPQHSRQTMEEIDPSRELPASPSQHIGDGSTQMDTDLATTTTATTMPTGSSQVHGHGSRLIVGGEALAVQGGSWRCPVPTTPRETKPTDDL